MITESMASLTATFVRKKSFLVQKAMKKVIFI